MKVPEKCIKLTFRLTDDKGFEKDIPFMGDDIPNIYKYRFFDTLEPFTNKEYKFEYKNIFYSIPKELRNGCCEMMVYYQMITENEKKEEDEYTYELLTFRGIFCEMESHGYVDTIEEAQEWVGQVMHGRYFIKRKKDESK